MLISPLKYPHETTKKYVRCKMYSFSVWYWLYVCLYVFYFRRRMRCTTNIYLTALAITDIIYLTMALLLSLQHYHYVHLYCKIYWMCYGVVVWLCDACCKYKQNDLYILNFFLSKEIHKNVQRKHFYGFIYSGILLLQKCLLFSVSFWFIFFFTYKMWCWCWLHAVTTI